jgi:hypothetical protein
MPKYKIAYYEDWAYLKIFEGKNQDDALKKAREKLNNNGWDTSDWETGNGQGTQLAVVEELAQ